MIHLARPTVTIVFCLFLLRTDERTDNMCKNSESPLLAVTLGWPSGSINKIKFHTLVLEVK